MSETTTETHVLDNVICVVLDITEWTGRARLLHDDIGDSEHLPPQELANLGSKKLVDPRHLRDFSALKRRAERILSRTGTRFLSGWIIAPEKLDEVSSELNNLRAQFEQKKVELLAHYNEIIEEWCALYPDWAASIRKAAHDESYVRRQLQFRWHAFRVQPPAEEADDQLAEEVGGLADELWRGIAREAEESLETSFLGREKVTRKALRPLKRIQDKLNSLSFLDDRIQPVAEDIDQILDELPKTGPIEGDELFRIIAILSVLASPERAKRHGQDLRDGVHSSEMPDTPEEVQEEPTTPDTAQATESDTDTEPAAAGGF